jgi:hypothetical protein
MALAGRKEGRIENVKSKEAGGVRSYYHEGRRRKEASSSE